ncbi:MAG: hypothetical protein WDN27_05040 [Candidatus Saccharibacteria bacterium]
MRFKDFVTNQRASIFIVGIAFFIASLIVSHLIGFESLWGELFIDLAASAITIVFTALIIDYLNLKERTNKTQNAAILAEDEIRATCFRTNWRLARLYGLQRRGTARDNVSTDEQARAYLARATDEVSDYLSQLDFLNRKTVINTDAFQRYLDRLQSSQAELEQVLVLYEYALPFDLREKVLTLRSELQLAERLLGFIDTSRTVQ